jgi:type I restriction enzyme S subunit
MTTPDGWKLVKANDVCNSISVGVVIKPSQYYVDEKSGIKAFRSANVREGYINNSDWVYFSKEGHKANRKSQLNTGDVLIVRTGYPGTACVVTSNFNGSNAIDIVIARPDYNQILPEYLCAYTNSSVGKSQVLNLQGGMAQKHLNVSAYQVLKIKLPTLPEQKQIVKIFSTWDMAIEITEKLLKNSQQQKKFLMQQLLTGKKRLPGFSGEWKNLKVSEIGKVVTGNTPPKSEDSNYGGHIFWATAEDFKQKYIKCTRVRLTGEGAAKARVVPAGSVLVTCIASIGKNAIAGDTMATNQQINAVTVNKSNNNEFFYYIVEHFKNKLIAWAGVTAVPILNKSSFEKVSFLVPELKEQQKIASILSIADKEIENLQQKLEYFRQEKKALMQQLLTGKRRVTL